MAVSKSLRQLDVEYVQYLLKENKEVPLDLQKQVARYCKDGWSSLEYNIRALGREPRVRVIQMAVVEARIASTIFYNQWGFGSLEDAVRRYAPGC